jgi:RNA polymerase sigma factor for flagellar operon FliA
MTATKQSKSMRASPRRGTKVEAPKPLEKMSNTEVWREYARSRDDQSRCERVRNFLMEKYLHLVRFNAERIYTRLPDEVDVEDLMSAGLFGLMDAIDAFDLDRNVKFETYCAQRIRGAILDELRAMDWVPRLVRHRTAKVESAKQKFEMKNGRPPTQHELSDILGLPAEEFEKVDRDGKAVQTHSITRKAIGSDGSKEFRELDVVREEDDTNPLRAMQRRDLKDLITRGLSRAERLIVVLYYYEGMTMKEIGATLDLSESRVSQMHSSILARLKSQMQNRTPELEPMPVD